MNSSVPNGPWDRWIPGALNRAQVEALRDHGLVTQEGDGLKIQPCSIDLTLSDEAYEMKEGSVKPSCSKSYDTELRSSGSRISGSDGTFFLKAKSTYVFRLREELTRNLGAIGIHGQATAKSSIGRLDVLARLVVDRMDVYEGFGADCLAEGSGKMYLEITPITFNIKVEAGQSLSQLRLFYGAPERSRIEGREVCRTVLRSEEDVLRLNLDPVDIAGRGVLAYRARRNESPILISVANGSIDPSKYWELVPDDFSRRIQIETDKFYILRSLERLWVPDDVAIYCQASDETIGEMRIHYAGFVHPGFGQANPEGTPLIFEVRGHQVKASLRHGEKMANLIFYRMSKPDHDKTPYDKQELKLSKIFAEWPTS